MKTQNGILFISKQASCKGTIIVNEQKQNVDLIYEIATSFWETHI